MKVVVTKPPGGFVWSGGERCYDGAILEVPDGAKLPDHLVVVEDKPKRKRRTRAEIEADKAQTEEGAD